MEIIIRKKLFLFGSITLIIATLIVTLFFCLNSDECNCDEQNEEKLKNTIESSYSQVYGDSDIKVFEKKLNSTGEHGVFDIDTSTIERIEKSTIDISNKFDCEWKGKEVDNYVIKESYCQVFKAAPSDANNDDWVYYKVLDIKKDDFTSNYQILIDDELVVEKELKTVMGTPIQAIKFIDNQFVVDYKTNLEIIPATEETKATQSKGYYSSIWINGTDILDNTEYIEAFSPNSINGKLTYFISDTDRTIFNYDGKIIDLPYNDIPHYGCCEESPFNIVSKDNIVDFFGEKDGDWYHVQIKGKE